MFYLLKDFKKTDWFFLFLSVLLIVAQVWLELKIPDYTANLTSIVQGNSANMQEVFHNGGLMLLCAFGSLFCAIICSILISKIASSFSMNLRTKLYRKITKFSDNEIKKFSIPSLITRTTNDVMQVQNFMAMGVQFLFKAPIMAVWAICKIVVTNVRWTVALVVSVAIIVVCISILVGVCLPRFKKIQRLTDDINNVMDENISGVRVIRAFNAEKYQEKKFESVNDKITKNNLITSRTMGFMNPVMTLVLNCLMLSIYWIGSIIINNIVIGSNVGLDIMKRVEVVGDMAAFTQYAIQVIMSFMMLILLFIILPRTIISSKRILEVLKTDFSIKDGSLINNVSAVGEIEFKNVCFSYPDAKGQESTLTNINFKVNKGETLAIIGATGSGKTTLVNLIPRFYDVSDGEVLVDGVNVKDYKEQDLRNKISFATQKAVLFKGTIKDNIVYGSKLIDYDRIENSIKISHSDFIKKLDSGIESSVSQGGTNFSGGQKQRISIARAVYKQSEIIIFDDTFSALDYKTDMLVRKSIKNNLKDVTTIIVAQRIGTIKNADKILVLDDGKIVGSGNHEDLLKTCKIYKEIALSQLSKEEL